MRIGIARVLLLGMAVLMGLAIGCSGSVEDIGAKEADVSAKQQDLVGKYQVLLDDVETGPDGLPLEQPEETVSTLFFASGEKFTLSVDKEKVSGTYRVNEGKVTLTGPAGEETIVLVIEDGGKRLVEDVKEDALVWFKVGAK